MNNLKIRSVAQFHQFIIVNLSILRLFVTR